jgi:hypothetical protein
MVGEAEQMLNSGEGWCAVKVGDSRSWPRTAEGIFPEHIPLWYSLTTAELCGEGW